MCTCVLHTYKYLCIYYIKLNYATWGHSAPPESHTLFNRSHTSRNEKPSFELSFRGFKEDPKTI